MEKSAGYLSLSTYLDLTEKDDKSPDQILIGLIGLLNGGTPSSSRPLVLVEGGRFPGRWGMESRSWSRVELCAGFCGPGLTLLTWARGRWAGGAPCLL